LFKMILECEDKTDGIDLLSYSTPVVKEKKEQNGKKGEKERKKKIEREERKPRLFIMAHSNIFP